MPERTEADSQPIQGRRNYDVKPPDELIRFMSEGWAPPPPVSSEPHPAVANFASRRAQISSAFPNTDLVIPTGIPKVRSGDDLYRFRPGSDFFWLTGHDEPDSVLVMRATDEGQRATLYVEPRADRTTPGFFMDAHRGELWVGPRRGLEETSTYLGIDCAPLAQLKDDLSALDATKTVVMRGYDPEIDATVPGHEADAGLATALSELRLIKDDHEGRQRERAVAATVRGFEDIVRALPDAMERGECVVEGVFGLRARVDGNDTGYGTIAAAGPHTTILHWQQNNGEVRPGDLLLVDAGVESQELYTADITRTVPVSGRFTASQRALRGRRANGAPSGLCGGGALRGASAVPALHAAPDVAHARSRCARLLARARRPLPQRAAPTRDGPDRRTRTVLSARRPHSPRAPARHRHPH